MRAADTAEFSELLALALTGLDVSSQVGSHASDGSRAHSVKQGAGDSCSPLLAAPLWEGTAARVAADEHRRRRRRSLETEVRAFPSCGGASYYKQLAPLAAVVCSTVVTDNISDGCVRLRCSPS
ncbi:hypothetical protein PF003_g27232 [Phytophthora fragariae]|nr:hypothetical protein PF003_g27232 [Phytophthora fragariae]